MQSKRRRSDRQHYSKCFSLPVYFFLLLLVAACGPKAKEPANILLVTIDTLRADHLSSYGYERLTSPTLDRLAAEGVRFERPIVQWPKTGPSFASIFTATYPKDNGIVRKVGVPLPEEFLMLAESLRQQGYATHAVVANGAVGSDFHFDQGFDSYLETWKTEPLRPDLDPNGADSVTDHALEVVHRLDGERPYFLWVHYIDPHFPYTPPEAWSDKFQDDEYFDPAQEIEIEWDKRLRRMRGIGREQVLDDRRDLAFYVARYDAEIAYADSQIDRLLGEIEGAGLGGNTLTVVTSDHGESLGEHHYYFDHGRFSFQTCLRVPLILHYPERLDPAVDEDPVELINLTPTLMEAAGVPLEDGRWMQGRSLFPRLRGEPGGEEERIYAFSEAGYEVRPKWQRIVQDERFKLIYAQGGGDQRWIAGMGVFLALYDLENDPGETKDLSAERPEELQRLNRVLTELWANKPFEVRIDQGAETDERAMDEETRKQLEVLGYLEPSEGG